LRFRLLRALRYREQFAAIIFTESTRSLVAAFPRSLIDVELFAALLVGFVAPLTRAAELSALVEPAGAVPEPAAEAEPLVPGVAVELPGVVPLVATPVSALLELSAPTIST